jgi:hypothetical protein
MERKVLTSALRPGSECLSIEQLGRYADGALSFADRDAAASHIDGCANCQAELALLHAFTTALVRDDEQPIVRQGVERLRRREPEIFGTPRRGDADRADRPTSAPFIALRTILSAAAIVLAVVGGYYLLAPRAPGVPSEVGSRDAAGDATRALAVTAQAPVGDQTSAPERFSWSAVTPATGAARYRVQLLEVDRREVWSTETAATVVDVPADVRALMTPGKTLLWHVTAIDASGAPIAQSGVQRFRVIRP